MAKKVSNIVPKEYLIDLYKHFKCDVDYEKLKKSDTEIWDGYVFFECLFYKHDNFADDKYAIYQVAEYGGEDMGSEYFYVFRIDDKETSDTKYIKFEGRYDSWNGVEWDQPVRYVSPVERTFIVYE